MHICAETSIQTAILSVLPPAKNKSSFYLTIGLEFVILFDNHHDWCEMAFQRIFSVHLYANLLGSTDGFGSLI